MSTVPPDPTEAINAKLATLTRAERDPHQHGAQAAALDPPTAEHIDFCELGAQCFTLLALYRTLETAHPEYSAAVKAVAADANVEPVTINRLIKKSANNTFDRARHIINQHAIVFEKIGRIRDH